MTQTAVSEHSDAAEEQDAEEKQAFVEALVAEEKQAAELAAVTPAPAALAYHT